MKRVLAAILIPFAVSDAALAAEMRSLTVEYEDGHYTMVSTVWFDAGLPSTYRVFSRWDYSERFSSAIVEARDLEADESGRPGFYVRNRGCVLFFCVSLTRRGYVERERNSVLRAFADPERSDFEVSNETWEFHEEGGGTVVVYTLYMKPAFWVPPAIGPFMIKRKLRREGGRALDRIEAVAQSVGRSGDERRD